MRLLKVGDDDSFSLTKFNPHDIPPYAILSHTWETDDQELTLQDMIHKTGLSKTGYRKVEFCGEQARKHGLHYIWVDSCCLDEASSSELTEAINSMFRWYRNANKCYVYLSDVSTADTEQQKFCQSRWFTRGWTLQCIPA